MRIIKKILLVESQRELLLFLLIVDIDFSNNVFVFFEDFDEKIIEQLKKQSIILPKYIPIKSKIKNLIKKRRYLYKIRSLKRKLKLTGKIYGYNHGLMGEIFNKEEIVLLEDGTYNMKKPNKREYIKYLLKKILFNNRIPFLVNEENVKEIYLTDIFNYNLEDINSRIKFNIINVQEKWILKTQDEKLKINRIFGIEKNIETLLCMDTILFTQPLSEDGYIEEEEKIQIYKKILKKYNNEKLIIKVHPREKTNYSNYFSDCIVLKEKCPIELLVLNGLNIKKAITLFSTAVFSFEKKVRIDFYGTEVHPKLLTKFGSMDYIMKRNKFLEENSYGKTNFNR